MVSNTISMSHYQQKEAISHFSFFRRTAYLLVGFVSYPSYKTSLRNALHDGAAGRTPIRSQISDTRGSALLIAIALVAILSIGSGVVYKSLHRALSEHSRFERDMVMSHLADAAIDKTLATLRVDPETALGASSLVLGGGMAHIEVHNDNVPHQYRIRVRTELRDGVVVRARAAYSAKARIAPDELPMLTAWQREKEQQ